MEKENMQMKQNSKKRFWVLAAAVMIIGVAVVVTGCKSGGGGGSSSAVTPPPADNGSLPPDPGEAGKATLAGIDSDGDGVRDDVQIAIWEKYPNEDDSVKRAALLQSAKAIQGAIVAGASLDADVIFQSSTDVLRSVDCFHEVFEETSSEVGFIESVLVNTGDRSDAYIEFNGALNGQFFGDIDTSSVCD